MNFSISQMQNNKALMSGIDKMYKSCGNKDERLDSLRDGRQMLTVYNNAYAPTSKNPTVFDPVLHEKHEYQAPKKVGPVA